MTTALKWTDDFRAISETIRRRRTSKDYSGEPIATEDIEALLDLAVFAPNHGLTEPWRFRVLLPSGISGWIHFLRAHVPESEMTGFQKPIEKVSKAGAVIYITNAAAPSSFVDQENYAATSAAIQNILLAATAQGLQSYWSTSKLMTHPKTKEFLNLPGTETFVGALWLGHGKAPEAKPRTPAREKTLWIQ